jgi:hypothetical protein
MFRNMIANLELEDDLTANSKRRHDRRGMDNCVGVIADKTYPVENWSQGGVLIYGDPRPFELNGEIEITLKFRMRDEIVTVPHRARVIRKSYDRVAFQFAPLTNAIKRAFQGVIDDFVASQFAESQLV